MSESMSGALFDPMFPPRDAEQERPSCPYCGGPLDDRATYCTDCGHSLMPLPVADRVAAAAAYLTLVPAVAFLFVPAFRSNRFVRFHAWQSTLVWAVFFVVTLAALILSNITAALPLLILGILATTAMFFLWIVLTLKAWQGVRFALPLFGVFAHALVK
jgi:uncharacterized membrane protein